MTDVTALAASDERSTEGLPQARDHAAPRLRLEVVSGPDRGRLHVADGARVVIGTHAGAGLVLSDNAVSRFHCELAPDARGVTVRDLGSLNGTSVDHVPVTLARLPHAAMLSVGRTQIRVSTCDEDVRIPISPRRRFGVMLGQSVAMRQAFAILERAAASDATVLLEGETGTGKEVAAESVHRESRRASRPFVVVDCGAIPPDLLEAELFGHERGAFTGAACARGGLFEAANGGTIFLDEIGELSLDLQPKLLRALERREVRRVGSNRYVPVDVRVITATNRDLRAAVNQRTFRSDLYYRLAVLEVRLPPLRERPEDIPLLVEHMMSTMKRTTLEDVLLARSPSFLAAVARHAWPGNVRELRNYVERCLAMNEAVPLHDAAPSDATGALEIDTSVPLHEMRERVVRAFEKRYLEKMLERSGGNVSAAARSAQTDRIHFHRLLKRHSLR